MRPATPAWGRDASCAFRVLGFLRVRGTFVLGMFGAFFVPVLWFFTCAVLMLGICPDCLRSEPRL